MPGMSENEECLNCGHEDFEHHEQDGCIVCGCTNPEYACDKDEEDEAQPSLA